MSLRTRAWLEFGIVLAAMILVTMGLALLLNLTGDCGPEVRDCGETQRRISFLVLAYGGIATGYYIYRFVRLQRKR